MPDLLSNLAMGFGVALTWQNLGLCLFGCMLGTRSACCRASAR